MLCAEAGAAREEARGDDAAVVEDEQIALVELRREVAEVGVGVVAGLAVDEEHAAVAAFGGRMLRDQFCGEMEIEIGDAHVVY